MYKRHKLIILFVFIFVFLACMLLSVNVSDTLLSSMLTVLSITFGLTITAITSLNGSAFIRRIAKNISIQDGIKSNGLQTLNRYFKLSCHLNLYVIIALMFELALLGRILSLPPIDLCLVSAVTFSCIIVCLVLSSLVVTLLLEALTLSNQD